MVGVCPRGPATANPGIRIVFGYYTHSQSFWTRCSNVGGAAASSGCGALSAFGVSGPSCRGVITAPRDIQGDR